MDNSFTEANKQSLEFFEKNFTSRKENHSVVGWSKKSQEKRFYSILKLGDLNERSLLDVGCGIADFYSFLNEKKINSQYSGIDISEPMLTKARENNPSIADRFTLLDITTQQPDEAYDYGVAIGIFNLNFKNPNANYEMTYKLIDALWNHTKIGFAISMTSDSSKKPNPDTFYYNIETIVKKVKEYTNNFIVDHSYLPHDFTIFIYKQDLYTA
jgi:SAM-dependent methyltransferase